MDRVAKFTNKELRGEESWHQVVKVVLEGARGKELDRIIVLRKRPENFVLMVEQLMEGSFMLGRSIWYKEDKFMQALGSQAGSRNQCTSKRSVE